MQEKSVFLGRRRFVGKVVSRQFSLKDEFSEFIGIKKFISESTTNRLLNNRWFVFHFENRFFIAKEVSSLPPLNDSIDTKSFLFLDIDFPEATIMEVSLPNLEKALGKTSKLSVFYFNDLDLQMLDDCDKMLINTIFFKNGIDFLRSTVLKELIN